VQPQLEARPHSAANGLAAQHKPARMIYCMIPGEHRASDQTDSSGAYTSNTGSNRALSDTALTTVPPNWCRGTILKRNPHPESEISYPPSAQAETSTKTLKLSWGGSRGGAPCETPGGESGGPPGPRKRDQGVGWRKGRIPIQPNLQGVGRHAAMRLSFKLLRLYLDLERPFSGAGQRPIEPTSVAKPCPSSTKRISKSFTHWSEITSRALARRVCVCWLHRTDRRVPHRQRATLRQRSMG
jgi:hypothetical protein